MRIISGTHKGRRVTAPKNFEVRPTTDFAKEALFNILGNRYDFNELKVLDLFAGIGGISLEFASRGVQLVHSVELKKNHAQFIENTADTLDLNSINVICSDVFKYLEQENHNNFDLIFADPPYKFPKSDYLKILDSIIQTNVLKSDGILILEHPKEIDFKEHEKFTEHRKYGNVNFSFFIP